MPLSCYCALHMLNLSGLHVYRSNIVQTPKFQAWHKKQKGHDLNVPTPSQNMTFQVHAQVRWL